MQRLIGKLSRAAAKIGGMKAVFIDVLSAAIPGQGLTEPSAASKALIGLRGIAKETGAFVCAAHYTGQGGHSILSSTADVSVALTHDA